MEEVMCNEDPPNACRLCGESNEIVYDLFETSYGDYNPIALIFEEALSIKISPGDEHPNKVCKACLDEAAYALDFKNTWQNSHSALGKYFQTINKNEQEQDDDNNEMSNEPEERLTLSLPNNVDRLYECTVCNKPMFSFKNLQHHMVTHVHSTQCRICKVECHSANLLKEHYRQHRKNKIQLCESCGGPVINGFHNSHFNYHCPICNFAFPCIIFLQTHIKFDHPNENVQDNVTVVRNDEKENIFECNIDNLMEDDLSMNVKSNIIEYKCSECMKIFASMHKLENHISLLRCNFICDVCGCKYKFKSQLKIHMMSKHLEIKPYSCSTCPKSFVRRSLLVSHQQVHSKERFFQCHECGKKFVSAATLRYHSRLHTGEKPYVCLICNEGFVKSSRLREHEQKWHIGKLQCPKCMTTFSQRCSLKTHMDRFHPNTYDRKHNYLMSQEQQEDQQFNEEFIIDLNQIPSNYTVHITEE